MFSPLLSSRQEAADAEAHRCAAAQEAAAALEAAASQGGGAGGSAARLEEEERQEAALRTRLAQMQAAQSEGFKALARAKAQLQAVEEELKQREDVAQAVEALHRSQPGSAASVRAARAPQSSNTPESMGTAGRRFAAAR